MEIRELDPIAAAPELLRLWNESLGEHFPLDERLWLQQIRMERSEKVLFGAFSGAGPDRHAVKGAGEAPGLLGLALVKRASRPGPSGEVPKTANLSALMTAKAARGRGIGSALLEQAEAWARGRGALRLHLGRDSWHFFPGAPLGMGQASAELLSFLEARGFALENEEHDVFADLGGLDLEALGAGIKRAPGYRTTRYEPALKASMESFLRVNFPGRWFADVQESLEAGMRPEDLLLLVEEASGTVVGFSRIYEAESTVLGPGVYWRGLMGPSPCGLGPIGVDEGRRGQGLGLRLLHDSIVELARRGGRGMMIDWTDLVDFYGKMGFRIWKSYRMCSKPLSEAEIRP